MPRSSTKRKQRRASLTDRKSRAISPPALEHALAKIWLSAQKEGCAHVENEGLERECRESKARGAWRFDRVPVCTLKGGHQSGCHAMEGRDSTADGHGCCRCRRACCRTRRRAHAARVPTRPAGSPTGALEQPHPGGSRRLRTPASLFGHHPTDPTIPRGSHGRARPISERSVGSINDQLHVTNTGGTGHVLVVILPPPHATDQSSGRANSLVNCLTSGLACNPH